MTKRTLITSRIVLSLLLVVSLLVSLCVGVAFAADEAQPQTKSYDKAADRLLDGLTGDGTTAAYRSVSWAAGQCDDKEDPIFKMASAVMGKGFDVLTIKLRSPDQSVKLADLLFIVRVSDALQLDPVAFTDDTIEGGVTLSSGTDIGSEWVTISIDFTQTELQANGSPLNTANPDGMLGFHLVSDATKAGKLDIQQVSVISGANETVLLNFDSINETWWNGSEGGTYVDVPRHYNVTDSKEIKSESANNLDEAYEAIVLGIAGSGNVTVAPIGEDGTVGTAKAWSELTDLAGTPVAALDGNFRNAVISLESLGAKKIQGVKVSVTDGSVLISQAFFTNLEVEEPDTFPIFDESSIAYLSQFNFEYLTAGSDYDKAVTDCVGFNMDYILSYSAKNNVITNGHLVLDAQGEAFTSIKLRSKVASEGRSYLVVKYKLQNGATLNDFRFDVIKTEGDTGVSVVYANQMLAGKLLPSLDASNPYSDGDYSYLIVDLAKTYGTKYISGVDMYISGQGQVLIDEIFYANAYENLTTTENVLAAPIEITATGAGYSYVGGTAAPAGSWDYMIVEAEGNLEKLRIEMGGGTYWFTENTGGTLRDRDGMTFPTGTTKLVIDLAKTGVSGALDWIHIHNDFAAEGDTLKINSIKFAARTKDIAWGDEVLADDFAGKEITAGAAGYAYVGWANGAASNGARYMTLDVEGDISQLRMEMGGGVYWFAENSDGTLLDVNGKKLTSFTGKQTIVIDLVASGVGTLEGIHFHNTFAAAGDVLKITSLKFGNEVIIWGDEVLADDFSKEITATAADYAYIGWANGSVSNGARYMTLNVDGDISQLRMEMGGGVYWFAENAQGTLLDVNGNKLTNFTGEQTIVIDLVASGVGTLTDIHFHNNFAAVGDVLKITSLKFGDTFVRPVLPTNDDAKPTVTAGVSAETVTVGDEVTISATAVDNYAGDVTLTYEVTLGGTNVTVTDGKFTAATEGSYTVTVTATDEAGNTAIETLTVVASVSHECADKCEECGKCTTSCTDAACADKCQGHTTPDPTPTPDTDPEGPNVGLIVVLCIVGVAVVAAVVFIIIKRKK